MDASRFFHFSQKIGNLAEKAFRRTSFFPSPKLDPFTIENSENIPHSGKFSDFCLFAGLAAKTAFGWPCPHACLRAPSNKLSGGQAERTSVEDTRERGAHKLSTGARRATSASQGPEGTAM